MSAMTEREMVERAAIRYLRDEEIRLEELAAHPELADSSVVAWELKVVRFVLDRKLEAIR